MEPEKHSWFSHEGSSPSLSPQKEKSSLGEWLSSRRGEAKLSEWFSSRRVEATLSPSLMDVLDVHEDGLIFALKIAVPGVDEEDLAVRIEDTILAVEYECSFPEGEAEKLGNRIKSHERRIKSFPLPPFVDPESATARIGNGILEIRFDKKSQAEQRQPASVPNKAEPSSTEKRDSLSPEGKQEASKLFSELTDEFRDDLSSKPDSAIAKIQDLLNASYSEWLNVLAEPYAERVEAYLKGVRRVSSALRTSLTDQHVRQASFYLGQLHAIAELAEMLRHEKIPKEAAEVLVRKADSLAIARIVSKSGMIGLSQLATELGKPSQNLHDVLAEMQSAGLIRRDQLGRRVLYSPTALTRAAILWGHSDESPELVATPVGRTVPIIAVERMEGESGEGVRGSESVRRYDSLIEKAIANLRAGTSEFEAPDIEDQKDNLPLAFDQTEESSPLNPRYTFDEFVIGSGNQFAHAACQAVAERPSKTYNPLFLYGAVGLGKTHLMQAIGHEVKRRMPQAVIRYISSEKFTNELINSVRYHKLREFEARFQNLDVLLIDDIQFIAEKERTQEEFFRVFNNLHESMKQVVIASDRSPKELTGIEDRLRTRFEWGLIADIQPPDIETKVAILQKKATLEKVTLPTDVALYVATNIRSNIRELEGALIRLVAHSELIGAEITLPYAQQVLKNFIDSQARKVTVDSIQKVVAEQFGLRLADIKSKNTSKMIVYPRRIAVYLAKHLTEASLPEIGRQFGGQHHTTVLHSVDKIDELRKTDKDLDRLINKLTEQLGC